MGQANIFEKIHSPDTKTVQNLQNTFFKNVHGKKPQIGILLLLLAALPHPLRCRNGQKQHFSKQVQFTDSNISTF